jgi:hypothetical protein
MPCRRVDVGGTWTAARGSALAGSATAADRQRCPERLSRRQGASPVGAFGSTRTATSEDLRAFVAGRQQDPPSGPPETARTRPARHAPCSSRGPTPSPGRRRPATRGYSVWQPPRCLPGALTVLAGDGLCFVVGFPSLVCVRGGLAGRRPPGEERAFGGVSASERQTDPRRPDRWVRHGRVVGKRRGGGQQ